MFFHILLALLALPILALGTFVPFEWDVKVDFDGQNNINSQGRTKQQDPEIPLGKSQTFHTCPNELPI